MFSKSAKESLLSPSRSASSMALSQTRVTSSGVSSPLVSLFRVFSRSSLQIKLSLLKSGPEPEHYAAEEPFTDNVTDFLEPQTTHDKHVTVDLEGVYSLELSGGSFTESRKHVDKVIEAQVPLPIL